MEGQDGETVFHLQELTEELDKQLVLMWVLATGSAYGTRVTPTGKEHFVVNGEKFPENPALANKFNNIHGVVHNKFEEIFGKGATPPREQLLTVIDELVEIEYAEAA